MSSQVKTALLSFGMSGRVFHAPFISLHPGFTLLGAWERTNKNIRNHYPDVRSYESLEAVLNDPEVKLVIVNTPTYTHYSYAKQALLAGKDIVVEKAFTTTLQEAVELKEIAEKQKKKIAVFQNRRWDSDFKTCQKILKEGLLGDLVEAELHFDRYNPILSPKKHKEEPGPGGGTLKDLGPHLIDQALCLFGMPVSLFADIRITRVDSKVDDWFDITLMYPTLCVRLKAGFLVKESPASFVFHGHNGSFLKSRADIQEATLLKDIRPDLMDWGTEADTEKGILHYQKDGQSIREKITSEKGNYYDFYDGVFKAISSGKQMPVTVQDGINVMQIIEKCIESSGTGRVVNI